MSTWKQKFQCRYVTWWLISYFTHKHGNRHTGRGTEAVLLPGSWFPWKRDICSTNPCCPGQVPHHLLTCLVAFSSCSLPFSALFLSCLQYPREKNKALLAIVLFALVLTNLAPIWGFAIKSFYTYQYMYFVTNCLVGDLISSSRSKLWLNWIIVLTNHTAQSPGLKNT